ncbi:hypothetical protein MBLNU230_g4136t1 [Neophaeotheca triangularis]
MAVSASLAAHSSAIQSAIHAVSTAYPTSSIIGMPEPPVLAGYQNFSSVEWDLAAHSLTYKQSYCYRPGSLPVALAWNDTCLPGFFCPNSTDRQPPQFCPPYERCLIFRAGKGTCNKQGILEPRICIDGHYCPAGGKRQIECPAGSFCPSGTLEPFKCDFGAICPKGSKRQIAIVPTVLVLMVDVLLGILIAVGFGISRWRRRKPKRYTTLGAHNSKDDLELLRNPVLTGRLRGLSNASAETHKTNMSSPDLDATPADTPTLPTKLRRTSGRADHLSAYSVFDGASDASSDLEEEFADSPDFQRFIRSMSRTIHTKNVGLSFDFENLDFTTSSGKKILKNVTGTMPRGSMWGIMGGSGAGKSTFMNVLMGKAITTAGTVKINGWVKDMKKYKKLIGYVPQDDIVFPELTVRENILHSARCRLPANWRDKAIQDHVDSLIACLNLTHVQHSRVGDANKPVISGGQRKRVNIGLELAAAPMAILLDEPTSGLDATSAASIMRLLKAISRLGVTTIAIIHQPREQIFYGFDQLMLLAQGRTVYSGQTDNVQHYFESMGFAFPQRGNPADIIIDIATGDGAQYTLNSCRHDVDANMLIDHWDKRGQYGASSHYLSPEDPTRRLRRISNQSISSTAEQEESLRQTMQARGATWVAQVYYCWKRATTQQIRNYGSFFFEIAVGALAGGIIGLSAFGSEGHLFQGIYHPPFTMLSSAVDYQSVPQIGLLGAMAIGLAAAAPGVKVFGEENLVYYRETASGHSRSAYYVGKVLSTLLRIVLSSFHFTVFFGVLATPMMRFVHMFAANVMYFWCIYGLASCVAMVSKREDGPLLAVFASLVIGILGGVAPPLSKVKSWGVEWLWRMSPGVWFTEAYFSQNLLPLKHLYVLELAAEYVGYTLGQYTLDIAMLFVIGLVYRVVAYLGLVLLNRKRQI